MQDFLEKKYLRPSCCAALSMTGASLLTPDFTALCEMLRYAQHDGRK